MLERDSKMKAGTELQSRITASRIGTLAVVLAVRILGVFWMAWNGIKCHGEESY